MFLFHKKLECQKLDNNFLLHWWQSAEQKYMKVDIILHKEHYYIWYDDVLSKNALCIIIGIDGSCYRS